LALPCGQGAIEVCRALRHAIIEKDWFNRVHPKETEHFVFRWLKKVTIALPAFFLIALLGCNDEPFGPQPGDHEQLNPTLCDINEQIFAIHCFSCHQENGVSPPVMNEASARTDVLDYLIVPGDAEASRLYQKVSGVGLAEGDEIMPPGAGLDEILVAQLKTWIDQGATEDCGQR